ncbi:MAG: methyltransferase domain-containing protein [Candidatus Njordarchaeales archaeon]
MLDEILELDLKIYKFQPKRLPVISGYEAIRILELINNKKKKADKVDINVALGRFPDIPSEISGDNITFQYLGKNYYLSISALERFSKWPHRIFAIEDDQEKPLMSYSNNHFYQLIALGPRVSPTIEINGIRMHRTEEITPFLDAKLKVLPLKIFKGAKILDICTGLGYTSIWVSRLGGDVLTIEKDRNVLELAEYNPWSYELEKIPIILEDALVAITKLPTNYFDRIINDPPRYSLAGELYSRDFFQEIFRVLKPGGMLFQYTGNPQEKYRGKKIVKGIMERLRSVGFRVRQYKKALGLLCIKPRHTFSDNYEIFRTT